MKHVIIQNCQPTLYFLPLRSKHYPQQPVLKITNLKLHVGVEGWEIKFHDHMQ